MVLPVEVAYFTATKSGFYCRFSRTLTRSRERKTKPSQNCLLTLRVPTGRGLLAELLLYFLTPQCRGFSRALSSEKSKSPLFPGSGGAVVTND